MKCTVISIIFFAIIGCSFRQSSAQNIDNTEYILKEKTFQQWENGLWNDFAKHTYEYNKYNLIKSEIQYSIINGVLIPSNRLMYEYKAFGKVSMQKYDTYNAGWNNYFTKNYEYDSDGQQTQEHVKYWDNEKQEYNEYRVFTEFDGLNNKSAEMQQSYNGKVWLNQRYEHFKYDDQGNLIEERREKWENENWINTSLLTCSFNESGSLRTEIHYRWFNGTWDTITIKLYFYNDEGLLIRDERRVRQNGAWLNDYNNEYFYDPNNLVTEIVFWVWNDGTFKKESMVKYEYDSNNEMVVQDTYGWNDGGWQYLARTENVIDDAGNLERITYYNGINNEWVRGTSCHHVYALSNSFDMLENVNLSLNFPNPFSDYTTFRFSLAQSARVKLDILDVTGRTVITLLDEYREFDTYEIVFKPKNLACGVYFYRLNTDIGYKKTGKMIYIKK